MVGRRFIVLADGENLVYRYQKILEEGCLAAIVDRFV
jgi:hypothetical protein